MYVVDHVRTGGEAQARFVRVEKGSGRRAWCFDWRDVHLFSTALSLRARLDFAWLCPANCGRANRPPASRQRVGVHLHYLRCYAGVGALASQRLGALNQACPKPLHGSREVQRHDQSALLGLVSVIMPRDLQLRRPRSTPVNGHGPAESHARQSHMASPRNGRTGGLPGLALAPVSRDRVAARRASDQHSALSRPKHRIPGSGQWYAWSSSHGRYRVSAAWLRVRAR